MSEVLKYKEKWQDAEFNKLFIGFKQFISISEQDCARRCAEIIAPQLPDQDIQVLELGAGDGTVSLAFLEALSKYRSISSYTGIDLSEKLVVILKSKKENFRQYAQEVHFDCADATTFGSPTSPHLVVAFCSWFGIPFQEILRYISLLEANGVLAITLSSVNSITIDLTNEFVEPIRSSEELLEWLKSIEIAYTRHEIISRCLEREDYLDEANINPMAESFFRYLLRRPEGTIEHIIPYLNQKPDFYFKTPKDLILLKEQVVIRDNSPEPTFLEKSSIFGTGILSKTNGVHRQ
jgi:hypothetical protein